MVESLVVFVDKDQTAHVFVENEEKFYSWLEKEEEIVKVVDGQQEFIFKKDDFINHLYHYTSYDSNLGLLRKLPTGHYISCDNIFDLKSFSVFVIERMDQKMSRMTCYKEEEMIEQKQKQPMIPPPIKIPV